MVFRAVNKFNGSAWRWRVEGHFSGGGRMQMSVCPVITAGMFAKPARPRPNLLANNCAEIKAVRLCTFHFK